MTDPQDYSLFHNFIQTYQPKGFNGIDRNSSLMIEMEQMLEKNNQFFFVGDMIHLNILFTSKRSTQIIGIEPANLTPYFFFEATHPNDVERHSLGRTQLFKLAHELFIAEKGNILVSTNLNILCNDGKYKCLLFQCYLFYSENPIKTVYILQIHTNIDWCKKIKKRYHYYSGNDLSYFKYPDEELLNLGNVFTKREFEIIKLIALGLNSEQIAEKLFVSQFTINAHRANILKKTHNTSMSEVIHDLKEKGML